MVFQPRDAGTDSAKLLNGLRRPLYVLVLAVLCACIPVPADEMTSTILIGNARIDVFIEKGTLAVSHEELLAWVQAAGDSVATYYGRFPVPRVLLRIIPIRGKGVRGGKTFGEGGGLIRIHVGSATTPEDLASDWMLTHEMIHLAFPSMPDQHHWIEEGISTYVEPIARVRAKHLDASRMWADVVRDLPQGLPEAGDKGLDHTHTWGRTYWGGALFCFLADIEIHRRTDNRKGLEDALRGILNAGGDIRQSWDLGKALQIGDQATGVAVLLPLYEKMKDRPYSVDLSVIWKELGIEPNGSSVRFTDSAPLAKTRQAITYGAAPQASQLERPLAAVAGRTARNSRSL
jgi:hypothetical protein